MTGEADKKSNLDGSDQPALEPGDFVYLTVEWVEPPDRGSPFSDRVGLLLGSGQYPVIERELIDASPNTQESYLIANGDAAEKVVPAPTLEDVFDKQTANLLNQLGFSSPTEFLTADLSGVTSLPVDHDRLVEMRESLSDSFIKQDLVTISVERVYRWEEVSEAEKRVAESGGATTMVDVTSDVEGGTGIERSPTGSDDWPSAWLTLGGDFYRSGAHNSGQVDLMNGTVVWTQGDTSGDIVDAAPMIMNNRVFVWTNRGILALNAASGDEVWRQRHPNLTGSGTGWPFTPQSPVGTSGRVYVAPQLVGYDAETGERTQNIGHFSTDARVSIGDDRLLIADGDSTLRIESLDSSEEDVTVEATDGPEDRYVPAYSQTHEMAFVTDRRGSLCAVDVETGSIEWRVGRAGAFRAPSIGSHAYAVTSEQILDAIDLASGDPVWRTDISHNPISDPAVTNERTYVTAPEGVYGIDNDSGETVFEYIFEDVDTDINVPSEKIPPRPTIVHNSSHHQIFSAVGDTLLAIHPYRGECVWTCVFEASITTQPMYANGRVYLRTADDRIHAIE